MNIVVCVKQIPDPASPGALDATTHALKRDGKLILDESDAYGVEMALQLVATAGSGEVYVVSMAPNGETSGMRTALAMGAVKGLLVSDPALAGSDALTTAKVLAAAVNKLGGADLIIAGTESSDGYTGTVPEQIAECLGLPSVTFAKKVKVEGSVLKVDRQSESGYDEVECTLPAVISVTAGVVEPRYPSFKGIMDAKKKPLDETTPEALGVDVSPRLEVLKTTEPPVRKAGVKAIFGPGTNIPAAAREILDLIRATRNDAEILHGASTRAADALAGAVRARAAVEGRDYGLPDDVQALLLPALLIAMLTFVEQISIAQTFAARRRERVDIDAEMRAMGAACCSRQHGGLIHLRIRSMASGAWLAA